jgi:hypothetical protein
MHVELDHVFVCVSVGGREALRLIEFGLSEGAPNRHPGQGTANRRFFFANAFLELVWVDDATEAQSPLVRRTGLWERWSRRETDASPFGICVRPSHAYTGSPPFAVWDYRPPYLPDPLAIWMSTSSERFDEPLLLQLDFNRRPDAYPLDRKQPLEHAAGLRAITRLRVNAPSEADTSRELHALDRACPWFSLAAGGERLLELGFDGEAAGHSHDFRPALPLLFRW